MALTALSLRTIAVLSTASPWTSGGWWATVAYAIVAAVERLALVPAAHVVSYACLTLLTVAFVVAGVRDERQADPWWWPSRLGPTRAERRKT